MLTKKWPTIRQDLLEIYHFPCAIHVGTLINSMEGEHKNHRVLRESAKGHFSSLLQT